MVDTTWEEGADYFGTPFRVEYVRRMAGAKRDYPQRKSHLLVVDEALGHRIRSHRAERKLSQEDMFPMGSVPVTGR